jgi:hypothetical protein
MSTVGVTGNVTFRAATGIFAAQWQHITTVTAPIGTNVGEGLEAMGNAMIYLLFIAFLYLRVSTQRSMGSGRLTPAYDFDMHFVTTLS